jgi:lipoprotein NlpD
VTRGAALVAALALCGCPASRSVVRPALPPAVPLAVPLVGGAQHEEPAIAGVVHAVKRGETIYRIARAYGIDAADLMETNGITDPRAVPVGTELFVPGAREVVEIPPVGTDAAFSASRSPSASPSPSSAPSPSAAPSASAAARPSPVAARAANENLATTPLAWPLKGVLYGRFGVRAGQRHDGIDLAAPEGTAVAAAADGTVIYAGEQPGYGAVVIVRHDGGLVTLYAHNSAVLVRDGARVSRGQAIAKVGQTGRTTGPHLHFEVREGTRPRNPLLFLP